MFPVGTVTELSNFQILPCFAPCSTEAAIGAVEATRQSEDGKRRKVGTPRGTVDGYHSTRRSWFTMRSIRHSVTVVNYTDGNRGTSEGFNDQRTTSVYEKMFQNLLTPCVGCFSLIRKQRLFPCLVRFNAPSIWACEQSASWTSCLLSSWCGRGRGSNCRKIDPSSSSWTLLTLLKSPLRCPLPRAFRKTNMPLVPADSKGEGLTPNSASKCNLGLGIGSAKKYSHTTSVSAVASSQFRVVFRSKVFRS